MAQNYKCSHIYNYLQIHNKVKLTTTSGEHARPQITNSQVRSLVWASKKY